MTAPICRHCGEPESAHHAFEPAGSEGHIDVVSIRNAALEEAAQVCDRREQRASYKPTMAAHRLCAADIRALKRAKP